MFNFTRNWYCLIGRADKNTEMSKQQVSFKYLICSDRDKSWGITVDNVGEYYIEPDYSFYPPPRPGTPATIISTSVKGVYWTITN